jgi:hypothetical protein
MSCFTFVLISTLASCIKWATCSIVTISRGGTAEGVLAMAVRALAMVEFTSTKPNSLSILSVGRLVPSKLQGWG